MKKVLVISYYWPPSGGSGVQRWLKFCKYLRDFGWEPIVYTPEDPDVDLTDTSLRSDIHPEQLVLRLPIQEPRRIYRQYMRGSSGDEISTDEILYLDENTRTRKQQALVWARSNLLIPDARMLWIKPSIEFLTEYLKYEPVDAIVSTGPPHSMHLIAQGVKRELGIPWIADFRDPWTRIVYYGRLPLTKKADKKHKELEQSVMDEADAVVGNVPTATQKYHLAGARRTETITNGYDTEVGKTRGFTLDKFTINHTGVLTGDRNHTILWEALRGLSKTVLKFQDDLVLEFVGRVDPSVMESATHYGLARNVDFAGYLNHSEAIGRMETADVLLLLVNKSPFSRDIIPGKMFEYMATGNPILMIGPVDGDAARILEETRTGEVVDYEDHHDLRKVIGKWYDLHRRRELRLETKSVEAYSRKNLTERMAALLDEVVEAKASEE